MHFFLLYLTYSILFIIGFQIYIEEPCEIFKAKLNKETFHNTRSPYAIEKFFIDKK
jgi:hypothetical protein